MPRLELADASAAHALAVALEAAGVGVMQRAGEDRLLTVNAAFCRLLGCRPDDLDGTPLAALVHRDDAARVAALLACRPAGALRIEVRVHDENGAPRWCDLEIAFAGDSAGRIVSTTIIAIDVSARAHAERALAECAEHHRNTVELAAQIHWTATPAGLIEEASPRWAEVTGIAPEAALGLGWLSALHPEDVAPTIAAWSAALDAKTLVDVEYRLRTPQGDHRWFRAQAAARFDERGDVVRWYGTLEDIDDRRRAEQALRESEGRFRLAAQAAQLGIWDFDAITGRREWSDEFKDMLGLDRAIAPEVETALALVVPEDRHLLAALVDAVRAGDSQHRFEVTLRIHRADSGAERWMRTSGWRIQTSTGGLSRILVTIRDVTEERTAEQRIRWAATHDSLTRLPNRAHFAEAFEAVIARAGESGSRIAMVLFDVDNLKATNDAIGHDAGDLLLATVAGRLAARLGAGAFVARLGGDEFAAFIELDDGSDGLDRIADALDALRTPVSHEGGTLDCQATAGAAFFPDDGASASELMKTADIALYVGKADRRGQLSTFRPEMRAGLQRRTSMLAVARIAMADDRIMPFYQPKIDLATGRLAGFEALLRWHDDALGTQGPETIAAAFEDPGLAAALGERMLARVCDDIARWSKQGLPFGTIAFNLSAAEFRHDTLADRLLRQLRRSGIAPALIELEITETVFFGRGAEAVAATLDVLHRAGLRIALDDFGTGYASLTHLQAFPIDAIKIDRNFVADLEARPGNAAIVDAVIGLGRRLGMDVVAEGIETRAQADYLAARGCTFGQGYLFGRAVAADEVVAMLSEPRVVFSARRDGCGDNGG